MTANAVETERLQWSEQPVARAFWTQGTIFIRLLISERSGHLFGHHDHERRTRPATFSLQPSLYSVGPRISFHVNDFNAAYHYGG